MLGNQPLAVVDVFPSVGQEYALALALVFWLDDEHLVVYQLLLLDYRFPLHCAIVDPLATVDRQVQVY